MARETRVRKPEPLFIAGHSIARCDAFGGRRWVWINQVQLSVRDLRRLMAWLENARAWVDDAKGGG